MKEELHDVIIMRDDDGDTYIFGWHDDDGIRKTFKKCFGDDFEEIVSISDIRHAWLRSVLECEIRADGRKWPVLAFYPAVPHTKGARRITICKLETK